ncbi:hypothetical protein B9Z55_000486 [Caenorhabditis nigoni]|nr:hypothetical protein B9Z55_000486 [Caenorhabditis nigoni]
MEDVTLHHFRWRKPVENKNGEIVYKTSETQTTEISRKDVECVANFQKSQESQTEDFMTNGVGDGVKKEIRISKEVLGHIYDFLRDDSKVNYDRLLEFHKFDKVSLETVQKYHVETSSLPLPVCAISAVFYSSTQFLLGDISGNISMWTKEKMIFENKVTDGSVTSLEMCRYGLLSGSDDGNVILWKVEESKIEKIEGIKLTVSDLSRKIRRSSTSNKPVAVVSMQVSGDEVCVATETGGLYLLNLPTLESKPLTQSATSIFKILYDHPYIAVVYHTSNSAIFNSEGLVDEIPFVATLAVRCGAYFIFSNQSRLIIWSMNTRSTVIDENLNCHSLCSLSNDTLQVLDGDFNLVSNFLNDH